MLSIIITILNPLILFIFIRFAASLKGCVPTLVMWGMGGGEMTKQLQILHDLLFHHGMFAQDFRLDFKSHEQGELGCPADFPENPRHSRKLCPCSFLVFRGHAGFKQQLQKLLLVELWTSYLTSFPQL